MKVNMRKALFLLVVAACYANAMADCAEEFYVHFDENVYMAPAYTWDLRGDVVALTARNSLHEAAFNGAGKTLTVLVKQGDSSWAGNYEGNLFIRPLNPLPEASVNKTLSNNVTFQCTSANKTIYADYPSVQSFSYGSGKINASFVKFYADERAFGFGSEYSSDAFYVLAADYSISPNNVLQAGTIFYETPAGFRRLASNAVRYKACCAGSCAPTANGCESEILSAGAWCDGDWLYEYSCAQNECVPSAQECLGGCANASCLLQLTCTDSDNGVNAEVKGTLDGQAVNGTYTQEDFCATDKIVVEHYCEGVLPKSKRIECDYACADGACAAKPSATLSPSAAQVSPTAMPPSQQGPDYGFYAMVAALAILLGAVAWWMAKRK